VYKRQRGPLPLKILPFHLDKNLAGPVRDEATGGTPDSTTNHPQRAFRLYRVSALQIATNKAQPRRILAANNRQRMIHQRVLSSDMSGLLVPGCFRLYGQPIGGISPTTFFLLLMTEHSSKGFCKPPKSEDTPTRNQRCTGRAVSEPRRDQASKAPFNTFISAVPIASINMHVYEWSREGRSTYPMLGASRTTTIEHHLRQLNAYERLIYNIMLRGIPLTQASEAVIAVRLHCTPTGMSSCSLAYQTD
jgi:hypothetical protein